MLFCVLPVGTTACAQIAGIDETSGGGRSSLTMTRMSIGATVERTPLRREGTPKDCAGAALFLASDDSSFLTGEIIEVNGGLGLY